MKKTLIERVELTSAASSITFSSIPQTYDGLLIMTSLRSDRASVVDILELQLNGATANRSSRSLQGDGSAVTSSSYTSGRIALDTAASSTSNTFGNGQIYIPNYAGSQAKSASIDSVSENNATNAYQQIYAFLWNDTAAVTSVTLIPNLGTNWVSLSAASLYGITAGSDGTTTVS